MRTYESAGFRHLSQKRIEDLSRLSVVERVHPDKHGVDCKELFENIVGEFFVEDGGLRRKARCRQFFEDPVEAVVLWCRRSPGLPVAAPDDRNSWGVFLMDATLATDNRLD